MKCYLGLVLIANTVNALISIKAQNTTVEYGGTDIDISCVVNGTSLAKVIAIQMKRSDTNIVAIVMDKGVSWQDKELQNRNGVSVNASISNVTSSYLRLMVLKSAVRYPSDMGSYHCSLSAHGDRYSLKTEESSKLFVNITGFEETFTNGFEEAFTNRAYAANFFCFPSYALVFGLIVLTIMEQTF
ncbi:uncharacterized protein LOC133203659 isoform X2 [Saccostrea echinata]|uniref:uncharacterized protein LOC133203659 isoform X2 n=1 Tax=Saccostrea echinata TaxID=191078 RepID=UPI002A835FE8|nr:uncharacterized protein LOC133203659 isoform X2 [Saccostrea echinata]